ncbi:MAG: hypothetical protein ABI609_13055 [Acidobacteriota bacterium]
MDKKAVALLGLIVAAPVTAATLPSGPELVVKSGGHHYQRTPAAAIAADGRAVVVWADANLGLRSRSISAGGALATEAALVANLDHPPVPGAARVTDRKDPVVVYDAAGSSFYVFWTNEIADVRVDFFHEDRQIVDQDVFGQRFDGTGAPLGVAFRVNTDSTGFQSRPQVSRLTCGTGAPKACKAGRFVVAWQSDNSAGVFARTLDTSGTLGASQVHLSPAGPARDVALAADDRGNVLALWDAPDSSQSGVFARTFNASLSPLAGAVQLNQRVVGSQDRPTAAFNATTRQFLAAWQGKAQPDRYRTYGRLLGASGSPLGNQFPITVGNSQWEVYPVVSTTLDGGFTAQWLAYDDHLPNAVRAVGLDGAGARVGSEFNVNQNRPNAQARLALVVGRTGDQLSTYEGFDASRSSSINLRWLKRSQ